MTEILGVLGAAALFVLFGLVWRGGRRSCGSDCACAVMPRDRGGCRARPEREESDHAER
jgi:hypothetical protein